jgi:predicted ester cyclase
MSEASRLLDEFIAAFNSHDPARIREGYRADARFLGPDVELEGADAATEYAMTFIRAFPDVRIEATNVIEGGDWIVGEFTYEGTHTAPLATPDGGEIPPTNRRATGRGVDILRLEGGKVVEEHLYFDQLALMAQLGLIPEEATA